MQQEENIKANKNHLLLNEKSFLLLLFFEVVNFIFLWYYFCVKRRCFYGHKKKTKCASAPYNFAPPLTIYLSIQKAPYALLYVKKSRFVHFRLA